MPINSVESFRIDKAHRQFQNKYAICSSAACQETAVEFV